MLSNDVRTLLPIGSVVMLKDAQKPLMIFGVRQKDAKSGREFDYVAVLYPEGNMGENIRFMFDHDNIGEVLFTGYHTEERDKFLEMLHNLLQNGQK